MLSFWKKSKQQAECQCLVNCFTAPFLGRPPVATKSQNRKSNLLYDVSFFRFAFICFEMREGDHYNFLALAMVHPPTRGAQECIPRKFNTPKFNSTSLLFLCQNEQDQMPMSCNEFTMKLTVLLAFVGSSQNMSENSVSTEYINKLKNASPHSLETTV